MKKYKIIVTPQEDSPAYEKGIRRFVWATMFSRKSAEEFAKKIINTGLSVEIKEVIK